jgi:hypothetical protein
MMGERGQRASTREYNGGGRGEGTSPKQRLSTRVSNWARGRRNCSKQPAPLSRPRVDAAPAVRSHGHLREKNLQLQRSSRASPSLQPKHGGVAEPSRDELRLRFLFDLVSRRLLCRGPTEIGSAQGFRHSQGMEGGADAF